MGKARKQVALGSIRGAVVDFDPWLLEAFAAARDGGIVGLLHDKGVRIAAVSRDDNVAARLRSRGLGGKASVLVDPGAREGSGRTLSQASELFLEAAIRLGMPASRCALVSCGPDSVAQAAAAGFGLVVGVDAHGTREAYRSAGAHVVIAGLDDLELVGEGPAGDPFLLLDADEDDEREGVRESLFCLGNGYVATRGARVYVADDGRHYPGTYFAGVFDRLKSTIEGRRLDEDAIVNAPNWLHFSFSVEQGPWLGASELALEAGGAELDLGAGMLVRRFRVHDPTGRVTSVLERRLVSMADPHLGASEVQLVAENWSGRLEVRSAIDLAVGDFETIEERLLRVRHLERVAAEFGGDCVCLGTRTVQSQVLIAQALRARVVDAQARAHSERRHGQVARSFTLEVASGQRVTCERIVAFHTSRDPAISDPVDAAMAAARLAGGFEELREAHEAAWRRLWSRASVGVRDETTMVQRLVNLHLFHVLQVASPHVVGLDVGLPARGLHGEGYLGHVFWDEMFVLPMLTRRYPSTARSLLAYRARRLGRARKAATAAGHRGAMFPWQSASDGREETPPVLYNPRSGRWMEDRSYHQRHIGLAVAFNFWQYFETIGDSQHLFEVGAEVILEVARFFADLASFDEHLSRYRIKGVMGPDEFHDGYPWRAEPGVDDNAYTNVMAAWLLERAVGLVELLRRSGYGELLERLDLTSEELGRFDDISRRLHVPFMGRVLAQFEGYERLEELDLDAYRARYGDLGRLDLILEAEGDSVRRYQVAKQPDALMCLYLFSAEELRGILGRLGYGFDAEAIRETIDFYTSRVTHGSSLSRVVHAWINARLDRRRSWQYLREALESDLAGMNRGTREGIHLGAMAGTVDLFERCYPGLEVRSDALWLNPSLPEELASIAFQVQYRNRVLSLEIGHDKVSVEAPANPADPLTVLVSGEPRTIRPGERLDFDLLRPRSGKGLSVAGSGAHERQSNAGAGAP
jgi:trehalose/maltose hydrolase-like predicted phosphorylase